MSSYLSRIFHEARYAHREKCSEKGHRWPFSSSPTVFVGPIVPTQTVGSEFLRCASKFASASLHLLARILYFRAMFGIFSCSTICLTALLLLSTAIFSTAARATVPESAKAAQVLQVIDGDTIIVDLDGRREHVRLIGIDTPESRPNHRAELQSRDYNTDQKTILQLGNRASDYTRELLPKKSTILLEFDVSRRDKYQRLLAYVWITRGDPGRPRLVNEEILRAGYAYILTIPPNIKYRQRLAAAFGEGRREKRGLWR